MRQKHIFVSIVDVSEVLPFCLRKAANLTESIKEQDRARTEMEKFIDLLEKNLKVGIWYMGMDVIEEKSYERFIFDTHGFLEIMTEAPLVLNAHFVEREAADRFCIALKKTLSGMLPGDQVTSMFIDSIAVKEEDDESVTVKKWNTMKRIRNN